MPLCFTLFHFVLGKTVGARAPSTPSQRRVNTALDGVPAGDDSPVYNTGDDSPVFSKKTNGPNGDGVVGGGGKMPSLGENRQALKEIDYERSVYEFSAKKPQREDQEMVSANLPELTASK